MMGDEYDEVIRSSGEWITKEYLEEVLSTKLRKQVTVTSYKLSAAVPAGQNYLSILYRTEINYTIENEMESQVSHIIIKGLPQSEELKGLADNVFDMEYRVYTELLPRAKTLIEEAFPVNTPNLAPEGYETTRPGIIIMEDLNQDGYKMLPRLKQLDFEHAKAALQTLARWHALSVKIQQEDPDIITRTCSRTYTDENRPILAPFIEESPKTLVSEMENWPKRETLDAIIDKLHQITPCLWEKMKAVEAPSETLNVINHGDFWMNNMLFKHDTEGNIESVKLIDFQLTRYASPTMDLHYFLTSSVKPHVLETDLFSLYDIYHESLMSNFAVLDLPIIYSKEQFFEELRDRVTQAIVAVSGTLAFVLAPNEGVSDLAPDDEANVFIDIYRMPSYQNAATTILQLFLKIEYLDDAITRTMKIVEENRDKEQESDSDQEIETETTGYDRPKHILARLKSSVRGAFRRILEL